MWPFSEKNTDEKTDDTIPGSERWNTYLDTSQKLNGITPNNGPVVVLSSHQSRLLCELRGLDFLNKYNNKEIRFKNGAVLKFMIRKKANDSKCTCAVDLVHDGELSKQVDKPKGDYKGLLEGTKPYFVKERPTDDNELYGSYKFIPEVNPNVNANEKLGITTNDEFNLDIFLIRHGEGTHNVTKMKVLHTSAGLTENGQVQAENTGKELNNLIPDKSKLHLCASDIKRAIETMDIVKNQLSMRGDPIYIIPCSHEISAKKPPCDGSGSKAGLSSRGENEGASNDYLIDPNLNLDTSMYNEFYNDIRRDHSSSRQHCAETSMFKQIIKMVQKKDEGDLGSQPPENEGDLGSQPPENEEDLGSQSRENEEDLGSQPPENEPVTLG
jgi:bisphosphoglycerate-dependent phosphoglycerate mutase